MSQSETEKQQQSWLRGQNRGIQRPQKSFWELLRKKVKRDQKWRKVMAFLMGMKWELKRIGARKSHR